MDTGTHFTCLQDQLTQFKINLPLQLKATVKFSILIKFSINLKYAKTRAGTLFNFMQA